jgi:hypothetical protein
MNKKKRTKVKHSIRRVSREAGASTQALREVQGCLAELRAEVTRRIERIEAVLLKLDQPLCNKHQIFEPIPF